MNRTLLISVIFLLLVGCKSFKKNSSEPQSYDIKPYVTRLESQGYDVSDDSVLFEIGRYLTYHGRNEKGNALIEYAFLKKDNISAENYDEWSVQNTKNGNYSIAINLLEKAMAIDSEEISGYYGWVLLYYYRDYERALTVLNQCDNYTPDFQDAPAGEDIHYLKGLCQMQLKQYQKAIDEFDIYINHISSTVGEDWVDAYAFVQKGRCLDQLGIKEEAVFSYQKAIKHSENCSEAYYFMALTQLKMSEKNNACVNLNISLALIEDGYRSFDSYVELFHEIFPQQIEEIINKNCK